MKFDQLVVLLPCQSLEDFDLQRKEADADQLLSAYSSPWHPLLLANARSIPRWLPATSPPPDCAGHLLIVPDCCEPLLPEDWLARAEAAGACVLRNLPNRRQMLAAALERLDRREPNVDPDLTADFLALGFCHLQVELLTRKLRYMSNLDETSFQAAALAAADEALKGDLEASRQHLQSAFDRLHEAREYFYPVDARLLDLTLVAESTLDASLQAELADKLPRNLLMSAEVVEVMAQREPATLDTLKQALADDRAALVGGERVEFPLPLLGPEAIELHLRRGLAVYEKHLERRPSIFGRRLFGLAPVLPQILDRLGFTGALHCTLDDGQFPTSNQSRIQWEGIDGTTIEAIGCLPLDAGRAESFLRLAEDVGNAMNLDHASTVIFAHWPGRTCSWYDDLRRMAAYGSVFGNFVTITDYFEQTALAGQRNRYKPDQYHSPYLLQDATAGRRDPISRWVRYFRRAAAVQTYRALQTLVQCCGRTCEFSGRRYVGHERTNKADVPSAAKQSTASNSVLAATGTRSPQQQEGDANRGELAQQLAAAVEASLVAENDTSSVLDERLANALQESLIGFSQSVAGATASPQLGSLTVNPWSFQQRWDDQSVDVPAMGFAWVDPDRPQPPGSVGRKRWFGKRNRQEPPPLAEDNVLRNEFFEVQFDRHTGAIQTVSDYTSRDPRLAQQIAMRLPHGGDPDVDTNYSIMAADELVISSAGPVLGEIVGRGRLLDREGRRVADFRQTTRARHGSRVIEIQIELDIERLPDANPWDSYYAARFAWKNEAAQLCRSVNLASVPTELTRIESPHFLDICRNKQHTSLLLGGLPYHRRIGPRKLDTLLVTHGETARVFRLGIGIDVPHPVSAALGFMAPPLTLSDWPSPTTPTGWLFHLDCRNVLAMDWEPLPAEDEGSRAEEPGPTGAGFRVRLLETDGRTIRLGLRCFRAVASACKLSHGDAPPVELTVEGDCVNVPIGPHQWIEVEARFAP